MRAATFGAVVRGANAQAAMRLGVVGRAVRSASTASALVRPVLAGSPSHLDAVHRRLTSLFVDHGAQDYIGEDISIAAHSLQAMMAARAAGESDEVQIAALMHDVGHLLGFEAGYAAGMEGCGTPDHEGIGADFLRGLGFSSTAAFLVQSHVAAKRYLCYKDPGYEAKLSPASRTTLKHQGGPMRVDEAKALEASGHLQAVLNLRKYDELGKDVGANTDSLSQALDLVRRHLVAQAPQVKSVHSYYLSKEQQRRWDADGMLVVRGVLAPQVSAQLPAMAEGLAAIKPGTAPFLIHNEQLGSGGTVLCRVENFCKNVAEWGGIAFGEVGDIVSQAYGEPANLFKDKLNFKGPGAAGFLCHQDATAYATSELASRHISVMVAIDPATVENGCLQVAPGRHKEGVLPNIEGVTAPEVESAMAFENVLVQQGDIVLFDSYLPHRSGPNNSNTPRRLAYLTYNPATEGDLHTAYYAKKRERMRSGTMSLNNDFAGKLVD